MKWPLVDWLPTQTQHCNLRKKKKHKVWISFVDDNLGVGTYIDDYHCWHAVASMNPANCTPDICNWPNRSYPFRNQRPNSMCDVAFSQQTYAEISVYVAPIAVPSRLVRIDPNRWHLSICDNDDRCSIPDKIVPVFHLVSMWTIAFASAKINRNLCKIDTISGALKWITSSHFKLQTSWIEKQNKSLTRSS